MMSWASVEGLPLPLGATWAADDRAYNFAIYAWHAGQVTLLLYGDDLRTPVLTYRFDAGRNKSGHAWHCGIPVTAAPGPRYDAYSIDGPRSAPHQFDPDKILFDPYARAIFFPPEFDREAARRPGSNAGRAPVGLLVAGPTECNFDWGDDRRPHHEANTVVYELHVGAFTAHPSSGVKDERRGTYAGLIEKIPYLVELGVTVVELMPVFQFDPSDGNYWGYMPLGFFAPHDRWARARETCEQHTEFRSLVQALHAADIEVVLDVVYNHTGEGDHRGPVYSFKGIDNDSYYMMSGRPDAPYEDFTGTGNTLNSANPYVRRFVRGDPRMIGVMMQRLYGSSDLFPDDLANAYHAYQSVNYVTSHDGFTLWDLLSYDTKRNMANGHGNTDGPADISWNSGFNGDGGAPAEVIALRKRQAKNLLCLLLLANGTPMLRAGDEFLQTQSGNNNPYNQDNATTWLDWNRLESHADVFRFTRLMIAFRKAHPSLCRSH